MATSTLIPSFYLVAAGGIGTPRISHAIFDPSEIEARGQAAKVIKELHPRYWLFSLCDTEGKEVASFEVKQPDPVVWDVKDLPGRIRR